MPVTGDLDHPRKMSEKACMIRWPDTTRSPCWPRCLAFTYGATTDWRASFIWRTSGPPAGPANSAT
jgi:hypothetical protein